MSSGRDKLLTRFKAGSLPTEDDFKGLITSMLHMEDEGYSKDCDHGLKITSATRNDALLTFYRRKAPGVPLWSLRHDESGERLKLHGYGSAGVDSKGDPPQLNPLLTLDRSGCVGVGLKLPQHRLHVDGFVAARGRTGTYPVLGDLKPDGLWKDLVKDLQGCVAFEVVASAVSDDDSRPRMALLHAHAVNAGNPRLGQPWRWLDGPLDGWLDRTFNRRKRIRCDESRLGESCDRLELSWRPGTDSQGQDCYSLAIRSRCNYGAKGRLSVQLTQLWPVPAPPPPLVNTTARQGAARSRNDADADADAKTDLDTQEPGP